MVHVVMLSFVAQISYIYNNYDLGRSAGKYQLALLVHLTMGFSQTATSTVERVGDLYNP